MWPCWVCWPWLGEAEDGWCYSTAFSIRYHPVMAVNRVTSNNPFHRDKLSHQQDNVHTLCSRLDLLSIVALCCYVTEGRMPAPDYNLERPTQAGWAERPCAETSAPWRERRHISIENCELISVSLIVNRDHLRHSRDKSCSQTLLLSPNAVSSWIFFLFLVFC